MNEPDHLAQALADRYRIERELGAGGMATVYLAEDLKHRRKVAIKVLRPELSAVLGSERFLKEIELTASLQHSNILPLFDSGAAGGLLYYVMPYVEGETLRARLDREHQLPIPEAVRIATAVAAALDYAHRHGAVHRDIKPENILLSDGNALVADFGIALALRDAGGARLTETGLSLGTPQYMSPEQATAERVVDARTDIYSLGAVLYEMLAGEPPFTAPTTQGIIAKLLTQPPVSLRLLRDTVPPGLEAAVEQALAKAPADRFASCREFSDAVASAPRTHSPGGGARVTETRLVPSPRATRRRWIMSAAAALAVLAVASLAWAALRNRAPAAGLPLERVQLTFTGNAAVPGISHDGSKVAYSTRQCDSAGRCTFDIVVQDIGGAGTATILRKATALQTIRWTQDSRHLVFTGSLGPSRWGIFSMPSLGGEPRLLGCCLAAMGRGDTVLVTTLPRAADTVAWVRWITAPDGVVHDSLALGLGGSPYLSVAELSGRKLLVSYFRGQSSTKVVMTRAGRATDSASFIRPNAPEFYFITPDREKVALWFPHAGRARDYDLVLYHVDGGGRLGRPDTVYRQLTIGESGDYQAGIEVYDYGPPDYSVWALVRTRPESMRWSQRRLAAATERMFSSISNSGDRVAIGRSAAAAPGQVQLSVMPFDSGPEVPLGKAEELLDWGWSSDDRSIVIAARRTADSVVILQLDVATGRSRPLATVGGGWFLGVESIPGGGVLLLFETEFRRIGVRGLPDSTFPLLHQLPRVTSVSPDGRAFALVGWDPGLDTVIVQRISLVDGSATRLASIVAEQIRAPRWLANGSVVVPLLETAGTMVWYSIPSAGGAAVRLGSPPRYPAEYSISADGRRAVARAKDQHTDIFMIRNFGELLKSK